MSRRRRRRRRRRRWKMSSARADRGEAPPIP
jgi:hypothetical protein